MAPLGLQELPANAAPRAGLRFRVCSDASKVVETAHPAETVVVVGAGAMGVREAMEGT